MSTTGHEHELVEVQGLKASMKKGGNIGIYNDVVCSTAGATAAKVTNTVPPSFSLTNKAKILVKFTYGINVANATLQVGENAAKPIFYQGSALDAGRVKAGMFVLMQYDGTNFNILGDIAKMDEYYKDLHAGLADNLFGETQTNDKFIFRPTAGIQDIESGEPPVGGGAIRKVEGNAVAWNQLVENNFSQYNNSYAVSQKDGTVYTVTVNNITVTGYNIGLVYRGAGGLRLIAGHKYLLSSYIKSSIAMSFAIEFENGYASHYDNIGTSWTKYAFVTTISEDTGSNCLFRPSGTFTQENNTYAIRDVMVFDLTLFFGSGNEPTTVEAFESWLSQNIGLKSYYPYNTGELIPVKDYKVKSVGFNMLDISTMLENTAYGKVSVSGDTVTLTEGQSGSYYVSIKNDINILRLPIGSKVCFSCNVVSQSGTTRIPDLTIFYKDGSYTRIQNGNAGTITKEVDYCYLYFGAGGYGVTVVLSDLCINLSYDDDKDGTYEPYEEHQVNIDVTKVYGKLNGSGDYVQVFPDGLRAAGDVHDEIVKRGNQVIGIKRVGSIDLGTLTWVKQSSGSLEWFRSDYTSGTDITSTILCTRYTQYKVDSISTAADMSIIKPANVIYIKDSTHSTAPTAQDNWLSGVIMFYKLATPQEYILDDDIIPVKYAVDDYGTEEVLLGNDEEVVSCAPTMTIKYGINAADTIADLPHDYVSCKPQSLVDSEQRTARNNIAAASQHDMDVVKKQLELIDKKVENDYWVDMGLPSGVIWAKRNIFTGTGNDMGFAPSEYSYDASFFSWGNKEAHNPISTTAFDYSFDSTNYASTNGAKLTGNIPLSQDAARENCDEPWRMPTSEEIKELFDNCNFIDASGNVIASTQANKLVTMSSVVGIRLKSKINGMILFLPCTGYGVNTTYGDRGANGSYWSSSLYSASNGRYLSFDGSSINAQNNNGRLHGFVIRPVM